jgi:hypothetical protein
MLISLSFEGGPIAFIRFAKGSVDAGREDELAAWVGGMWDGGNCGGCCGKCGSRGGWRRGLGCGRTREEEGERIKRQFGAERWFSDVEVHVE